MNHRFSLGSGDPVATASGSDTGVQDFLCKDLPEGHAGLQDSTKAIINFCRESDSRCEGRIRTGLQIIVW